MGVGTLTITLRLRAEAFQFGREITETRRVLGELAERLSCTPEADLEKVFLYPYELADADGRDIGEVKVSRFNFYVPEQR